MPDIKTALKQLDILRASLQHMQGLLESFQRESERVARGISSQRARKVNRHCRMEDAILTKGAIEKDIQKLKAKEAELVRWLAPLVERLPAGIPRLIVRFRILDGMGCTVIAGRLHHSRSFVYKALAEGLGLMEGMVAENFVREA